MSKPFSGAGARPGSDVPQPLMAVRDLRIGYGKSAAAYAVDGVSFDIRAGETLALVGESGSGKTTLAQALIRLLPPAASVRSGTIDLSGTELCALSHREMRSIRGRRIGLVPQDPGVSLNPVHRIGDQIVEALQAHSGLDRGAAWRRAVEVLEEVGFGSAELRARQYPHELSGGMRQRVLIGMALAGRPELLIADEPTSGLDVTVQRVVLDYVAALAREHGTAVLLVTHDLGVAAERADRVAVMQRGRIVELASARDVLERPQHEYTKTLLAAAPSLSPWRRRATAGVSPADEARGAEHRWDAADLPPIVRVDSLRREFHTTLPSGQRAVTRAIDGVSFDVRRGETFAIVGESGSGKTTTARVLARHERASSGRIEIDGSPIPTAGRMALRQFRSRVQMVYQNPYTSLDPRWSIAESIEEPLRSLGLSGRRGRRDASLALLDDVGLSRALAARRPGELSGGQRQRVAIARALSTRPRLVILDEPVSALDVSAQAQVLQLLVDLQAEYGLSYVFISHDLAVVRQVADRVAVMSRGRIVESGSVDEVFSAPKDDYTRTLLAAVPRALGSVG